MCELELQVLDGLGTLSNSEKHRYSRHLLLEQIGLEGQLRLKQAKVLIVGAGGLGAPAALYLAAAGVGTLGLIDFDKVELSNLQRQVLYSEAVVGELKVEAAQKRLKALNPGLTIQTYPQALDSEIAPELIAQYDIVLDGTDNFPTRYLLNDCCVWLKRPCVHGSVYLFEGQVSVFYPGKGPCYRCLFPEPPPAGAAPNCAEAGVLGVLPGQIGVMQATEVLKCILNLGEPLIGRLLRFDALKMAFTEFKISQDPSCLVCGDHPTITNPIDYPAFCGQNSAPEIGPVPEIEVEQLKAWFDQKEPIQLIDIRKKGETDICAIPGSQFWPMQDLEHWQPKIKESIPVVITCRSGIRGASLVAELQSKGFPNVVNLKGGVLAWLDAFDSSQPHY